LVAKNSVFFPPSHQGLESASRVTGRPTYYRKNFLQFDASTASNAGRADLTKDRAYDSLAWVICHFVPLVCDNPKTFRKFMAEKQPLAFYMSYSDLAFAIVVLEHHMLKWRSLVGFQLETGQRPSEEFCRQQSGGLLYKGGISGEQAKRRFNGLCHYLFSNFCPSNNHNVCQPEKYCGRAPTNYPDSRVLRTQQQERLQTRLNELVKVESSRIKADIKNCPANVFPPMEEVQEDVLHRVYHCCYL
jgi:hypothetical protein